MAAFALSFDLRAPDFGAPVARIYAEALEMAAWGDANGIAYTILLEHHGSKDGYLPTPFVMGSAIAARTSKMRIQTGAVLLPLHDPIKIAEQIAVLDLISNGRLDVVLGAGYVRSEFAMFKRKLSERGKAMDEGVPIILRALSGERFNAQAREIFVRPLPVQSPFSSILIGGGVPASVDRAVRHGLGICPMKFELISMYKEECAKRHRKPGRICYNMGWTHIAEDPDRAWSQIGPHVLHVVKSYAEFAQGTTSSSSLEYLNSGEDLTTEQLKQLGIIHVMTPDEVVAAAKAADDLGNDVVFTPLIGGLDPEIGWSSLELFATKVLPRIRVKTASELTANQPR
jgi:alkanesulfonate monooxygenase SsuD/methylene tetrahydromethanopterin reductase-like flavin-dependent oxidoreductase (luciferase family)